MRISRIEEWSYYNGALVGRVYGHPKFKDGTRIITTPIERLDLEHLYASTKNTVYVLGQATVSDESIVVSGEDS